MMLTTAAASSMTNQMPVIARSKRIRHYIYLLYKLFVRLHRAIVTRVRPGCLTECAAAATIGPCFGRTAAAMVNRQPKKKAESQPNQAAASRISDEFFMACALAEARQANQAGEVPVGAVVVLDN